MTQYDQIRNTAPHRLQRPRRRRTLNTAHVLFFFLAETILFVTVGAWVQYRFPSGGLVMTELGMLALSIGFVLIMGASFRDVFPIRKPKVQALLGSLVMWCGLILLSTLANVILLVLFPDVFLWFSESESELGAAMSLPLQILVIAVLPAICEEALHRGVIQTGIRDQFKNRWAIAVIMGVIFAVFHLYPIRYPSMFIIGAAMSLVHAETGNMIYSSLIHFWNNLMSLMIGFFAAPGFLRIPFAEPTLQESAQAILSSMPLKIVGFYLILCGLPAPVLLYTGNYLVRRATAPRRPAFLARGRERETLLRILIPTIGLVVGGFVLLAVG